MTLSRPKLPFVLSIVASILAGCIIIYPGGEEAGEPPPTLILVGGKVRTLDTEDTVAEAIAIRGERIVRVGAEDELRRLAGPSTRILPLRGCLVLPGFIDSHTHFRGAGELLVGLNLLDVNDREGFVERVRGAAARLPEGEWITGGDWGAYARWRRGSAGGDGEERLLVPHRSWIDPVTRNHPALIRRYDGAFHLANSLALEAAGITAGTPDPEGGVIDRDQDGSPTGLLSGTAVDLVLSRVREPSRQRRLTEARAALAELRRNGVTGIHDISSPDSIEIFETLRKWNELTVRVCARPTYEHLDWLIERLERMREEARAEGRDPSSAFGDEWIRFGGMKGFVDGIMGNHTALFLEPYRDQPTNRGGLRAMMSPEGNLDRIIAKAVEHEVSPQIHAIGDAANRILLDAYEKAIRGGGLRDRRFRVIHAQVLFPEDIPRFGELGLVAEVQPYHAIDDMRWMEERIGSRARWAYAFRSLLDAGAVLSFGSDWPGTNASLYPASPLLGIYAAVTRKTLDGKPEGGWFPEERITVAEAVRAYTVANAYASFEEDIKGRLVEGYLADLVVLTRDIYAIEPEEILDVRVKMTVVGGKIVYQSAEG